MDPRLNLIYSRRSVRQFSGEPLAQETLTELFMAAMAAPSAKNRQPWHFVAITDQRLRTALAASHPFAPFARQAGVVVAVCGEGDHELLQHDLAAATQNLLLAAAGLGLGACWCGMTAERQPSIRALLRLPDDITLGSLVCIGHPAEASEPRTHYNPERIHWEQWES
jgi:nitroreductase